MNKKNIIAILLLLSFTQNLALAKMTKEVHQMYKMASYYESKQDYTNAISQLERAIAINGDDFTLYTKIAGLYQNISVITQKQ